MGTESNKIILYFRFNEDIKNKANFSFLDIPLFNHNKYNDTLLNKLQYIFYEIIEKNPFDMFKKDSSIISRIKQIEFKITNDPSEAKKIYARYIETLETIIHETRGGRKKRNVKSKPKTKRRSKKTI